MGLGYRDAKIVHLSETVLQPCMPTLPLILQHEVGGCHWVGGRRVGRWVSASVVDQNSLHQSAALNVCTWSQVMVEAVENHMPQVIVIDEIGTEKEAAAASTIAQRGVQLIATAHGGQLANLIKNPALQDLAGGIQVGGVNWLPLLVRDADAHSRTHDLVKNLVVQEPAGYGIRIGRVNKESRQVRDACMCTHGKTKHPAG